LSARRRRWVSLGVFAAQALAEFRTAKALVRVLLAVHRLPLVCIAVQ
jgi:hypothetical protein